MSLVVLTGEVDGRWKRVQTAAFKYKQVLDLYEASWRRDDSDLEETKELEFENLEQVLDLYQAEWRSDDSELLEELEKRLDGLFENLEAAYLCWLRAKLGYQADHMIRMIGVGEGDWRAILVEETLFGGEDK